MKHKFKIITLLTLIGIVLFYSCQMDDEQEHVHEHELGVTERMITLEEFNQMPEAKEMLSKIMNASSTQRSIYNLPNDIFINTDHILRMENGRYHSFTFPVFRLGSATNLTENLVLSLQDDGSYQAALYRYDLTEREKEDISMNRPTLFKQPVRQVIEGVDPSSLTNRMVQIFYSEVVIIPCGHGIHTGSNMGSWGECKSDQQPRVMVVTRSLIIETDDEGSGGTGGSGGSGGSGGGGGGFDVPPFDPVIDMPGVKGHITKPLVAPKSAEQLFYEGLTPEQQAGFVDTAVKAAAMQLMYVNDNSTESVDFVKNVLTQVGKGYMSPELGAALQNYAAINLGGALAAYQYLEENEFSEESCEQVDEALEDIKNNKIPNNILNLISDSCVKKLVEAAYSAKDAASPNINNVFLAIFQNNPSYNIKYINVPSFPGGQNARTSPDGMEINEGDTIYNFKCQIKDSYITTATDIAIAGTIIHENLHAILLYMNEVGSFDHVIEDNPSYSTLLTAYIDKLIAMGLEPPYYLPADNNSHHAFMASFVNDIAKALKAFGISKGYDQPDNYYNALAWAGLTHIYDSSNPPELIENPAFVAAVPNYNNRENIKNRIEAEKTNQIINNVSPVSTNHNPCN